MPGRIIDGKAISDAVKSEVAQQTSILKAQGITPGLGFILVGTNPASESYVRMKGKACEQVGFYSLTQKLPADTQSEELLSWIDSFNRNPQIHGFLVQFPLPNPSDEKEVVEAIDRRKDVDCFHPYNVGKLSIGEKIFSPCTPAGIVELLLRSGINPSGKHVVIVGRSNIVGRPLATLLSCKGKGGDATVTLCHSKTLNLWRFVKEADIVVAAIGSPEIIRGEMLKPGCVLVDVGINRIAVSREEDPRGYKLVGDVHFKSAVEVAQAITPVPGGVGPMTIAMLLKNTLKAVELFHRA